MRYIRLLHILSTALSAVVFTCYQLLSKPHYERCYQAAIHITLLTTLTTLTVALLTTVLYYVP